MLNINSQIFANLYELDIAAFPWRSKDIFELAEQYRKNGLIRQFGGILNPKQLGYYTTLIACKVSNVDVDKTANIISSNSGVSHNYLRDNEKYNLWFTFSAPKNHFETYFDSLIFKIRSEHIRLDCLRKYKLAFDFNSATNQVSLCMRKNTNLSKHISLDYLSESEKREMLIAADILQSEFPLVDRPFKHLADMSNGMLDESKLIYYAKLLKRIGLLRRIGAIWNHRKLGLTNNVLCLWQLPEQQIDEFGISASVYCNITHCYHRTSYSHWPWQIYTMIHGKTYEQCKQTITNLKHKYPNSKQIELPTLKEYKKELIRYEISDFEIKS